VRLTLRGLVFPGADDAGVPGIETPAHRLSTFNTDGHLRGASLPLRRYLAGMGGGFTLPQSAPL